MPTSDDATLLGHVDHDQPTATNERILIRALPDRRTRILRNQFVTITDRVDGQTTFLGRLLNGPFFPTDGEVLAEVEIQGELDNNQTHETNNRPAAGSPVHAMQAEAISA